MATRKQGKQRVATTKQPTGLSIIRKGGWFALSWKVGDKDYKDGQFAAYSVNKRNWAGGKKVKNGSTYHSVNLPATNYFPYKNAYLHSVRIKIRGKRTKYKENYDVGKGKNKQPFWRWVVNNWSPFSIATFTVQRPKAPTGMKAELDATLANRTKFSWSVSSKPDDAYWFTDFEWQSKLFKDNNETNGAKLNWSGARRGTQRGTSITLTEETETLASGSCTRWVRVRSRGPAGVSAWSYVKYVYAVPNQPKIKSATYADNGADGYLCSVRWSVPETPSKPITKVVLQYTITTPEAGITCPSDASWTDALTIKNTGEEDAAVFPIDRTLGLDQCLFVRVNTQYGRESNITYGQATLVTDGVGFLKDPRITNINFHDDTFRADITATNESGVEDSFLVVVYRPASNPTSEQVVGIIPHGEDAVQVQAPDWSRERAKAFGVYAAVGDPDNISRVSALMKSENIVFRGGEIPTAPQGVATSATDVTGTVRVSWDWTWDEATGAELSWSDHADAWESTDEPSTYEVSHINASQWNISGLETGVKWYVRVRLISGTGDAKVYSPYSEITEKSTIDLTSAPSIPTLNVTPAVITQDGSTVASWVYTTTDGTEQSYAEICEATITDQGVRYGSYNLSEDTSVVVLNPEGEEVINDKDYYIKNGEDYTKVDNVSIDDNPKENGWYEYRRIIARTETEQRITINAREVGWKTGNTYLLCVKVISASGRVSDEWSAPTAVTIAEPLELSISQTSLDNKMQAGGDIVVLTTEQAEEIYEVSMQIDFEQEGSGDPSPDNIRPITGTQSVSFELADAEGEDVTTYTETFPNVVYNGRVDFVSGKLVVTSAYIDSYAGEEITTAWTSDRDVYRDDIQPTIGAQVVYDLDTPVEYNLTENQIQTLVGDTYITSDNVMSVVYHDSTQGMLRELPLTVNISGVSDEVEVNVAVERAEQYKMARPDETTFRGYEHETIALVTADENKQAEITINDLIGSLDDGALYRIVVTARDALGQSATDEKVFSVHWNHQAIMPEGTAVVDNDNLITRITPIAPQGALATDVCDIYRLSADRPELIVRGATFGTEYVDPYPAIGQFGGHRLVFRTANGDYITDDNKIAWLDLDADSGNVLDSDYTIIDSDEGRVLLQYNIDLSNQWDKDFEQTQYLGGSVQGDWNPAVKRKTSVSAEVITLTDQGTILAMRRLATYAGICHVRTKDGSSFAADVQVSEKSDHDKYGTRVSFSLSITRVDQEALDGITAEEYFLTGE